MKLTKGQGSPETGACWMSAIRYYETGCDIASWSDHPECVSPIIRTLCVLLNDRLPDDAERERVIGPHLFTPIGTRGDAALEQRRAFRFADIVIRTCIPRFLRVRGFFEPADGLAQLEPIADARTEAIAKRKVAVLSISFANVDVVYPAKILRNAVNLLHHSEYTSISYPAIDVVDATQFITSEELLTLILEMCSWSDRPELDTTLTRRVLREACKQND